MCSRSGFVAAIKAEERAADVRVSASLRVELPPHALNVKLDPVNSCDVQNITVCEYALLSTSTRIAEIPEGALRLDLMDSSGSLTCSGTTN